MADTFETGRDGYKSQTPTVYRVGAVSYFNARPLIDGLIDRKDIVLTRQAPARMAEAMDTGSLDAVLLPSIDFQRTAAEWLILPDAAISSQADVLTVRVLSHKPCEQIDHLACDTDSHSSVALAQIVWHLRYGRVVPTTPLTGDLAAAQSVLLIGDKVLGQLDRWRYQLDLGQAWTQLTGLPFVYAFWALRPGPNAGELAGILHSAYRSGTRSIDRIVDRYAAEHGFEKHMARKYLTDNICYEFAQPQRQGLTRFFELANQLGLTDRNRPIEFCEPTQAVASSKRSDTRGAQRCQTAGA